MREHAAVHEHCTDLGILDIVFGNGKFGNVILEITSLEWPFSATVGSGLGTRKLLL